MPNLPASNAVLDPVQLSTFPVKVFSVVLDLPRDVEAEVDLHRVGAPNPYAYLEWYAPRDGHFPIFISELLLSAGSPERERLEHDLREEISLLKASGIIGDTIVPEGAYEYLKDRLTARVRTRFFRRS